MTSLFLKEISLPCERSPGVGWQHDKKILKTCTYKISVLLNGSDSKTYSSMFEQNAYTTG
jgi:hypothetical protein